jgi:hypothetical protein
MAYSERSLLFRHVRGQIGKQIVIKQYGKKTVISAYPNMSGIKPSKLQKQKRSKFSDAVAYAQSIIHNPALKDAYAKKLKKGQRIYNAAIREFLRRES